MKKTLRTVLLILLLVVLIIPAFSAGQKENVLKKEGTIKIWVGWSLLMDVFKQVKKDYEAENPGVDLEIAAFKLRDFEQKLAISIPAGQAPDVFITSEYIIPQYIEAGYIAKPPKEIVSFDQ